MTKRHRVYAQLWRGVCDSKQWWAEVKFHEEGREVDLIEEIRRYRYGKLSFDVLHLHTSPYNSQEIVLEKLWKIWPEMPAIWFDEEEWWILEGKDSKKTLVDPKRIGY